MIPSFKNVILISVDDLRFDALSAEKEDTYLRPYGLSKYRNTPTLDRIYREGVVFSGCRSTQVFTPQSHASLLTGQYPPRHGLRKYFPGQLSPQSTTLSEKFQAAGFATFHSIDIPFAFLPQKVLRGGKTFVREKDESVIDEIRSANDQGQRTFSFFHMGDVHFPYGISQQKHPQNQARQAVYLRLAKNLGISLARKLLTAKESDITEVGLVLDQIHGKLIQRGVAGATLLPLYLSGVNSFSELRFRNFLRILKERKILSDTLLVLTSDHGEVEQKFEGRTWFGHGLSLQEEAIRVPLIFWNSQNRLEPRRWSAPISSVDIAPTLLELAGLREKFKNLDGFSRAKLVQGVSQKFCESECFTESWHHPLSFLRKFAPLINFDHETFPSESSLNRYFDPVRLYRQSIRAGVHKLVEGPARARALYNTYDDPLERFNLLDLKTYRFAVNKCSARKFIQFPDYEKISTALVGRLAEINGTSPRKKIRIKKHKKKGLTLAGKSVARQMKALGYF